MMLIDRNQMITYLNPRFQELFGYDLTDIPDGKTWLRRAYPDTDYRHSVISVWLDRLGETPGGQRPRIFTVSTKDGTKKEIGFIAVQLSTGENLISCEDITDRKRLETQLFQSQKMEAIRYSRGRYRA